MNEHTQLEHERNLENYIDYEVYDPMDTKVGTLKCIWSDSTGEPAYVGVQTAWIFGRTHVVPAQDVQISEQGRKVRLPYPTAKVKDAPSYDQNEDMTPEKENEVNRHYGMAANPAQSGEGKYRDPATIPSDETVEQTSRTTSQPRPPAVPGRTSSATPEQATIQLSEEELRVGKRTVEAGGVRLRKIVKTEIVNQPVELKKEELVIERVPASEAHTGRQQAFNEQEVFIPLRREEAVVQKEAKLREEVRARKRQDSETQQLTEKVRREDIEIEGTGEAKEHQEGTPAEEMRKREEQPRSFRRRDE